MDPVRRYTLGSIGLVVVALGHALMTWPLADVVTLFVGGAAIALALEAVGVAWGLFEHEQRPQVRGVPVVVVGAWPAIVYLAYRVALLALPHGVPAAAGAAVLAATLDLPGELDATAAGVWRYPEHPLSRLRWRGVPLWNTVAWLAIVFVTAMAPTWL